MSPIHADKLKWIIFHALEYCAGGHGLDSRFLTFNVMVLKLAGERTVSFLIFQNQHRIQCVQELCMLSFRSILLSFGGNHE